MTGLTTGRHVVERLEAIVDRNRPTMGHVAFRCGWAYASDGRFIVKASVDHADECPAFPFDGCEKLLAANGAEGPWCAFDCASDAYAGLDKRLAWKMRKERDDYIASMKGRYTRCECPCCGNDLYFDEERGKLLADLEEDNTVFRPCDITLPVRLVWPHEQKRAPIVNFGYLHMLVTALGEDIQFATTGGEVLAFRTHGGDAFGVLMPMTLVGGGDDGVHDELRLEECRT